MMIRWALMGALLLAACGDGDELPEDSKGDSGTIDGGWDAGPLDGRVAEGGRRDAS